jgi:hypothetical protein
VTCPRHDRKKGVLESFSNCGHRDSTDCTDQAQSSLVFHYLQEASNSTTVMEYFSRMYSTFGDVLVPPIVSLPTTCAWKLIEDPDQFGFNHILYFVVVEAGIAWDLSSNVFTEDIGIVGGIFIRELVEYVTSCSLYEEKSSGWVTTVCPGNACNFAWGRSGGKHHLQSRSQSRHVYG